MPAATYRDLLRTPAVSWLLTTSVIGRFNQGMTGLALLMLITEHHSYAVAGLISTASVAGAFLAGPLLSRWADTHGRRRVLAATSVLNALTMTAIVLAPAEVPVLAVLCFLSGMCTPPLTAAVRAALPALVGEDRRKAVFALESTLQELIFVLGPPATAMLAAVGGPRLAVAACGACVLVGTLGYARDRNADIGRQAAGTRPKSGRVLRTPGIPRVLAAGALLYGALACQSLGVIAVVSGSRVGADAGFVVAAGSLGSLVGGLVYGSLSRHRAQLRHLMLFVAVGLATLPLAPGRNVLTILVFCWGLTLAPAMSQLFERLSSLAPPESATEAFGWMNSVVTAGNALGAAFSGVLITTFGVRAPLVAACVAAALAAAVCEPWSGFTRRSAGDREPDDRTRTC
ncbi:MFS transporter [Streptomyces sp. NPDC005373]|uniref:MFS transporter n=1 Tax=Streptomyces sp. NPDC005373 TaxID=3156879 RepID=UPI0033A9B4E3